MLLVQHEECSPCKRHREGGVTSVGLVWRTRTSSEELVSAFLLRTWFLESVLSAAPRQAVLARVSEPLLQAELSELSRPCGEGPSCQPGTAELPRSRHLARPPSSAPEAYSSSKSPRSPCRLGSLPAAQRGCCIFKYEVVYGELTCARWYLCKY